MLRLRVGLVMRVGRILAACIVGVALLGLPAARADVDLSCTGVGSIAACAKTQTGGDPQCREDGSTGWWGAFVLVKTPTAWTGLNVVPTMCYQDGGTRYHGIDALVLVWIAGDNGDCAMYTALGKHDCVAPPPDVGFLPWP